MSKFRERMWPISWLNEPVPAAAAIAGGAVAVIAMAIWVFAPLQDRVEVVETETREIRAHLPCDVAPKSMECQTLIGKRIRGITRKQACAIVRKAGIKCFPKRKSGKGVVDGGGSSPSGQSAPGGGRSGPSAQSTPSPSPPRNPGNNKVSPGKGPSGHGPPGLRKK